MRAPPPSPARSASPTARGLEEFARRVAVVGKTQGLERVLARRRAAAPPTPTSTRSRSRCGSTSARRRASARGPKSAPRAGRARNHNWHVGTRGLSRPQLATLAEATHSSELAGLATSDLWWDEVASIEDLGEQETYDLTVPVEHNFVADDVVVHNSALMANFAEHAALTGKEAVALFSLEMCEGELAQRFIASQASIKGDDLRKGKVPQTRWAKILAAVQPARRVGAVRRRLLRPLGARRAREDAPARPAAGRRARPGPHRLPPAHARHRRDRQPRRAGRPDLAAGSRRSRASSRCR